ncbi:MAG: transcriptional repressor [Bacteroidales bacterium]|nr:transcriptional repressor [Bacteroidales bacterium]
MNITEIRNKLKGRGLKVTPQRIAVLEAVTILKDHPTAERIAEYIRKDHPDIATGTVYKILEKLVDNKLIMKVKTDKDIMRYDAILYNHHHLYSAQSERIENYFDEELDQLLRDYFEKKDIPDFRIEEIKLQIMGKFLDKE